MIYPELTQQPNEVLIIDSESVSPKECVELSRSGYDTWWDYKLKALWAWR